MNHTLCPRGLLTLSLFQGVFSCAMDPGTGFATLEEATLEVSLDLQGAGPADGRLLTDQGYEVDMERAVVRVERMELQEARAGTASGHFDPAAPPPGYGPCHAGHCHSDDGTLVEYEEIEAELAAGGEWFAPLVTLEFEGGLSMLAREPVTANGYAPSHELPHSSPRRVLVILSRIEIEGTVSAGDLGDGSVPLTLDLPIHVDFAANLRPVEIDRDGPESVVLSASISVDATLFDGIDFAALDTEAGIIIDDPDDPAALQLSSSLAESEIIASLD